MVNISTVPSPTDPVPRAGDDYPHLSNVDTSTVRVQALPPPIAKPLTLCENPNPIFFGAENDIDEATTSGMDVLIRMLGAARIQMATAAEAATSAAGVLAAGCDGRGVAGVRMAGDER